MRVQQATDNKAMKVGDLARATGVSIRTLHYYEEIGLLAPTHRTASGHRLYAPADVARLQQIRSLQQIGLSLEQIADCLGRREFSPRRIVELQLQQVRQQIDAQRRLCRRLEALLKHLRSRANVPVEEFIKTVQEMTKMEKYFTLQQMEEIRQRGEKLGPQRIAEVEAEWPKLMEQVRAEMDKGTDPSDPRVQKLAKRWMDLVREFTGGNPEISKSVGRMWQTESNVRGMDTAPMREMMNYISRATAAGKQG